MKVTWTIVAAWCALLLAGAGSGIARAQHLDVLVGQVDGCLVTGRADFDGGEWTLGQRVYSGEFDGDFAVNNPGYNGLGAGSPSLPADSQALPGNAALEWDFLPMTIAPQKSNLFYWNGLESDGVPGITPGDVMFGALPGVDYTLGLFDKSGTPHTVNGASILVPSGVIDDTAADGSLHRHRFYQLLDNDGNGSTLPAGGIYLFAMQLRMAGLTTSRPIYMVFGTPGSSVASLDVAAVPWVETRVDTLIGLPGDYNQDGRVDAADYVVWRETLGSPTLLVADGNMNGVVDVGDYGVWRANFGTVAAGTGSAMAVHAAVPEPSVAVLLITVLVCGMGECRRRQG
jgi:hypothetical protein